MRDKELLELAAKARRAEAERLAKEWLAEQQRKGEERERQEASRQRVRDAAPAMLETLQNLENDAGQIPDHAWVMVCAAIKLATGETK